MNEPMAVADNARVEIELVAADKTREKLEFVLVPDNAADLAKGRLGLGTPLAQAILGHTAGETLEYKRGDIVRVKILNVQPNAEALAANVGEQREESLRRARDKAQHANMVSFALTFDSKWGDYDPENIQENWQVPTDTEGNKSEATPDAAPPNDVAPKNDVASQIDAAKKNNDAFGI